MDVKELRLKLGCTQKQIAKAVGVSLRSVQGWENSGIVPAKKIARLKKIEEEPEKYIEPDKNDNAQDANGFVIAEKMIEQLNRQLDELVQFRQLLQKKDEQIDVLISMLKK
ncbi:MAG: helix-turn-helix transcriptional regulator [Paludibacteraceae bacterium]|nr:helix-turn-helix transcriptional regulator [Paludibacteraceae bacterium]MBQ6963535.1 helix-turn-helix transcriptional regulator [Paludibacteraceae bacterium]MBQ7662451.1 helix-turn-helix transcriptional regulator [Prevotella sp.]MBQ7748326.1 helix-turn-helix transcriptional regulator [Paludibacteraceae bacterium]